MGVIGESTDMSGLKGSIAAKQEPISSTPDDSHGHIFSLLTACEAELQQIESKNASTERNQRASVYPSTQIQPVFYEPLLPPTLTEHLHNSIQKSLTDVMAQRDEAHAQLIG